MKGYRLTFLRNGKTRANAEGIYIGKTDWPLSDVGRAELEEKYDMHRYPKVERVYSSPLTRALQSAEILFPDREIVICDEMTEMDFGVFEGLSVEQLLELDSYKNWIKGGLDNAPQRREPAQHDKPRLFGAQPYDNGYDEERHYRGGGHNPFGYYDEYALLFRSAQNEAYGIRKRAGRGLDDIRYRSAMAERRHL